MSWVGSSILHSGREVLGDLVVLPATTTIDLGVGVVVVAAAAAVTTTPLHLTTIDRHLLLENLGHRRLLGQRRRPDNKVGARVSGPVLWAARRPGILPVPVDRAIVHLMPTFVKPGSARTRFGMFELVLAGLVVVLVGMSERAVHVKLKDHHPRLRLHIHLPDMKVLGLDLLVEDEAWSSYFFWGFFLGGGGFLS